MWFPIHRDQQIYMQTLVTNDNKSAKFSWVIYCLKRVNKSGKVKRVNISMQCK